nr:hypothetical protein [Tanacetum cinerariifolium]
MPARILSTSTWGCWGMVWKGLGEVQVYGGELGNDGAIVPFLREKKLEVVRTQGNFSWSSVPIGLSAFAMAAACASRAAATPSVISCRMVASIIAGVADESNIGDIDNTGDGGKIAGRAITTWGGGNVSYACMTSIFESSCKGEKTSMSKRYLVKLFKESGEMLPGEAEK